MERLRSENDALRAMIRDLQIENQRVLDALHVEMESHKRTRRMLDNMTLTGCATAPTRPAPTPTRGTTVVEKDVNEVSFDPIVACRTLAATVKMLVREREMLLSRWTRDTELMMRALHDRDRGNE